MIVRILIGTGALGGLFGVGLAAAAAHAPGGSHAEVAARFLLAHAPALLALAALIGAGLVSPRVGGLAAFALLVGLALFAGDLTLRAFRGYALFPMAAPAGGILLMLGWALLAIAALLPRRPARTG